jgi:hypothetical protein
VAQTPKGTLGLPLRSSEWNIGFHSETVDNMFPNWLILNTSRDLQRKKVEASVVCTEPDEIFERKAGMVICSTSGSAK